MNIKTLKTLLAITPNTHTVMLKGQHGIGKTEVVRWCAEHVWKQECIEFQASQISDVGDLIGLQRINVETGHTEWVPPYWYKADKPVTLFLDELNRGTTLVTNAMMQLANDHRLLNFKLPEGSHIIVAINPGDDGNYDVEEFDAAKLDRFVVYNFKPEVQEWIDYALENGVHSLIVSYIGKHSGDLDAYTNAEASKVKSSGSFDGILPSRRSWMKFNAAFKAGLDANIFEGTAGLGLLQEMCAGYVGTVVASKFITHYKQYGTGIDASTIMESKNFEKEFASKIKKMCKTSKAEIIQLGQSVAVYLQEHQAEMVDEKEKVNERGQFLAKNFFNFLSALEPEPRVEIYTQCVTTARKKNIPWVKYCSKGCPELHPLYVSMIDNTALLKK